MRRERAARGKTTDKAQSVDELCLRASGADSKGGSSSSRQSLRGHEARKEGRSQDEGAVMAGSQPEDEWEV